MPAMPRSFFMTPLFTKQKPLLALKERKRKRKNNFGGFSFGTIRSLEIATPW
jgi:hypothetical protein